MVRIQRRISRKRYLNSKHTYEYERMSIHIPRKLHELVKPFLQQDLDITATQKGDSLILTLTPAKTFRHAENTPTKKTQ
ncbi:MAG: hypothetical protein QXZ70_01130 [Candidatus Bathyarchaeia archaeon]